ncbi:hypothetical protein [Myroides odoratimimus]|uniref:hypothetical protein n=1 Tax=Myroides odoratimimus TaxID=76832 RepID=UPI003F433FB2
MITPELKDSILNQLINLFNDDREVISFYELATTLNTKPTLIEMILKQFYEQSLLSQYTPFLGEGEAYFELSANAFDLQYIGGFKAKEELLKLNLDKLSLEIESLKNSTPETAERISTIIANIAAVATFMFK